MSAANNHYNGKDFAEWQKEWALEDRYNFRTIESKWQKIWDDEKVYRAEVNENKEKFYLLVEFPYPSGAGLHVGHPRSYTALDVVARKKRMQGYNVLYPMGLMCFIPLDGTLLVCRQKIMRLKQGCIRLFLQKRILQIISVS